VIDNIVKYINKQGEEKMNPLTQIHVENLMNLLNNYLVEVFSQINRLERDSLKNLNELNYEWIERILKDD